MWIGPLVGAKVLLLSRLFGDLVTFCLVLNMIQHFFSFLRQEWLDRSEKKQAELKPQENPVLVVKDIDAKQGKLDRELLYLLNKAKYYVPKPKVNETGMINYVIC